MKCISTQYICPYNSQMSNEWLSYEKKLHDIHFYKVFMSFRLTGRDKQWSVNQDKFVYPSLRTANTWSVECHDKKCALAPISLPFFLTSDFYSIYSPLPIFPQNRFTLMGLSVHEKAI